MVGLLCHVVRTFSPLEARLNVIMIVIAKKPHSTSRITQMTPSSGLLTLGIWCYRKILPHVARYSLGIVAVGTRRYIDWLDVLHRWVPFTRTHIRCTFLYSPKAINAHHFLSDLTHFFFEKHINDPLRRFIFIFILFYFLNH